MMNAFYRATDAQTSVLPFRSPKTKTGIATRISPLAVVDPRAIIGEGCEIGPFCIVGPEVIIGTGNKLLSHVVVAGHTTIGKDNVIHPHAVLGGDPQDKKYRGEDTKLEMGDRNQIREAVTIHTGTQQGGKVNGGGVTRVGCDNLLMVNSHVGHDAQIGNNCIIANNVMLAGHIVIGDNVVINGAVGVNAFVTIGDFAYIAGAARIHHDVPPFVKISDEDDIRALNSVGLRRGQFADADIEALEEAFRRLFSRQKPLAMAMAEYDSGDGVNGGINPHVKRLIDFLRRRTEGKHGRYLETLRSAGANSR
jgi:UDP-N-acetylglucosamine acyltransferase